MEIKINDTTSIKVSNAILSTSNGIDFILSQHDNSPIVLNIVRNEPNTIDIKTSVVDNNYNVKEETSKSIIDTPNVDSKEEQSINVEVTDKYLLKAINNIDNFIGMLAYTSGKEFGNSLLYKMMIRMMNMKMGNRFEVEIKDLQSGKKGKYFV
jgi:hypothetical protein